MQLSDETPVKIVNNESRRFTCSIRPNAPYGASTTYVLEPDATAFWTWRVAKHWLGDPTVSSDDRDAIDRELVRANSHFDLTPTNGRTAPDVEVWTMEGERIVMAIQRTPGVDHEITTGISPDDMASRMAALQAEIELLRSNMSGDLPPTEALTPNDPDAGADTNLASLADLPTDDSVTPGTPTTPRTSGAPRDTPIRAVPSLVDDLDK